MRFSVAKLLNRGLTFSPGRARAAKYQRDNNLNYMLYVEPGAEPGAVRDRLNVSSYPTAVLLDASGRVLWRGQPAQPAANRDALEAAIRQALGR